MGPHVHLPALFYARWNGEEPSLPVPVVLLGGSGLASGVLVRRDAELARRAGFAEVVDSPIPRPCADRIPIRRESPEGVPGRGQGGTVGVDSLQILNLLHGGSEDDAVVGEVPSVSQHLPRRRALAEWILRRALVHERVRGFGIMLRNFRAQ